MSKETEQTKVLVALCIKQQKRIEKLEEKIELLESQKNSNWYTPIFYPWLYPNETIGATTYTNATSSDTGLKISFTA
jgi:hypothetical protein